MNNPPSITPLPRAPTTTASISADLLSSNPTDHIPVSGIPAEMWESASGDQLALFKAAKRIEDKYGALTPAQRRSHLAQRERFSVEDIPAAIWESACEDQLALFKAAKQSEENHVARMKRWDDIDRGIQELQEANEEERKHLEESKRQLALCEERLAERQALFGEVLFKSAKLAVASAVEAISETAPANRRLQQSTYPGAAKRRTHGRQ